MNNFNKYVFLLKTYHMPCMSHTEVVLISERWADEPKSRGCADPMGGVVYVYMAQNSVLLSQMTRSLNK